MKTLERVDDVIGAEDELMELQLRIARRADELVRSRGRDDRKMSDWDCWIEAEREVLSDAVPSSELRA